MKFYVRCGKLRVTIAKPSIKNHLEAAMEVMLSYYDKYNNRLSNRIYVNETGFTESDLDKKYDLLKTIKKAGFEL